MKEKIARAKKPTPEQIADALKRLRVQIETSDPVTARISQAAENSIRWVTEKTAEWPEPDEDAIKLAEILKGEI